MMSEILQQKKFIKSNVTCLCDMHRSLFIHLQHRTLMISKPAEYVNGPAVLCIIIIIIIIYHHHLLYAGYLYSYS